LPYPEKSQFAKCPSVERMEFKERFKEALRKRMHPNTALRVDDLGYSLGIHGMTLRTWLRGESCASGPMVAACIDYFTRHGDHGFIQELYPNAVLPFVAQARAMEKAVRVADALADFIQERGAAAA
jgi:hypothetical protein